MARRRALQPRGRVPRRLGGEQKPVPRIFGRPFELHPGEPLSPLQLEQRLNDVGYAKRAKRSRGDRPQRKRPED